MKTYSTAAGRRRRAPLLVAAAVVVAVAAGAWAIAGRSGGPSADRAATAFAAGLTRGNFRDVPFANAPTDDATIEYLRLVSGLGKAHVAAHVVATETDGSRGTARLRVRWSLPGASWSYVARVALARHDGGWAVRWQAADVHPRLRDGDRLELERVPAPRGRILGAGGSVLVKERPVVDVGVEPARVRNVAALTKRLSALLGVEAAPLAKRIRAAKPHAFVDVITLRREDYEALRSRLYPLAGTVFLTGSLPLAPTRTFARALLGSVGPATAELVNASHGRLQAGDLAGLSGLEAQYDARLAGRPGLEVEARGDGGSVVLFRRAPVAGRAVATTLDERVQRAADAAIAGVRQPSALVALDVASGDVEAVAVGPDGGGYDLALEGRYPPGSGFKIVTTQALLAGGLATEDVVSCPAVSVVDGKSFHNAEHEVLGDVPFHVAFARSCNTAFVGLASRLPFAAESRAASLFGIGGDWRLGVPVFSGSAPVASDAVDRAAASFGQGRVLVSPLAMASVAASVARGYWRQPRLLSAPSVKAAPDGPPIAGASTLRELMREVVVSGTGTAAASVPGAPVYGKTGTAEYGTDVPPRTHAWFVGWQGGIAFAVLVADTKDGFGGDVAAPIAAAFLASLGRG
ncbi:MAG TPA: penicillin-binding transpeptidase domain-containing protein [Gaiellaceae bacterium]|nr:penicillin-binding transpeptidase domain-containing protein [Gaiellaceae bacterium]